MCSALTSNTAALSPSVPLYEQIRESLRADIVQGRLKPTQRVPSEKELMGAFGVSRITVRQALGDLERDGLILRVAGKGSFVAPPETKPTQELARLQGFAEAMSPQGYVARNRVLSIKTLEGRDDITHRLGLAPGSALTEIRRIRYLDQTPVSFDISYVSPEIGARLARENLAERDIFQIFELDFALPLGYANQDIQALAADSLVAAHLQIPLGSPVLYVERLAYTQDGTPLEFDVVHYRGDAFRYRVRMSR